MIVVAIVGKSWVVSGYRQFSNGEPKLVVENIWPASIHKVFMLQASASEKQRDLGGEIAMIEVPTSSLVPSSLWVS